MVTSMLDAPLHVAPRSGSRPDSPRRAAGAWPMAGLAIACLIGCQSIDTRRLVNPASLPSQACLPPLEITLDDSLAQAWPPSMRYAGREAGVETRHSPRFGVNAKGDVRVTGIESTQVHLPAVKAGEVATPGMLNLAREIFAIHLTPLVVRQGRPIGGSLIGRVVSSRVQATGQAWRLPTLLTLGVSTLCGMPAGEMEATVTVELRVVDASGAVLGVYTGQGAGHVYEAAYYGYGGVGFGAEVSSTTYPGLPDSATLLDTGKAAAGQALSNALGQASACLMRDAERLTLGLERGLAESAGTRGDRGEGAAQLAMDG